MQVTPIPKFAAVINNTGNPKIDDAVKTTRPMWTLLQQQVGEQTDFTFTIGNDGRFQCLANNGYESVSYAAKANARDVVNGSLTSFLRQTFSNLTMDPADIREASKYANSGNSEDQLDTIFALVDLIPNPEVRNILSRLLSRHLAS